MRAAGRPRAGPRASEASNLGRHHDALHERRGANLLPGGLGAGARQPLPAGADRRREEGPRRRLHRDRTGLARAAGPAGHQPERAAHRRARGGARRHAPRTARRGCRPRRRRHALRGGGDLPPLRPRRGPALRAHRGRGAGGAGRVVPAVRPRGPPAFRAAGAGSGRPARSRPAHRLLLPGAPRLSLHHAEHPRRVPSRRAAAGGRLAGDLHPRHAALPPRPLAADARCADAHRGADGLRQGAGGAGDRAVASYPLPGRGPALRGGLPRGRLRAQSVGSFLDADRVRALRPPPGRLHRRRRRPSRVARGLPAARHRVPRRDRRGGRLHPGQAAARAPDPHVSAGRRHPGAALPGQDRGGHQPRPRRRDGGRSLPARPLLPPLR